MARNTHLSTLLASLALLAGIAWGAGQAAAQQAPQPPFPSPYGPDDEIGAANNLSPELVVQAAKLVKTGKTYSLGIDVSSETPAFPPRFLSVTVLSPGQQAGKTYGANKGTYNDDILVAWLGIATQIDGLGHLGADNVYYNNNKSTDFVRPTGLVKLGIEKIPPIVTRGVVLDIAGYKGVSMMTEGEVITVADIEGAARKQNVTIEKGDVVLLHTGWLSLLGKDDQRFVSKEPGIGIAAAEYLGGKGVVAVGADTWGVEAVPFEAKDNFFPAHVVLLAKHGVYLLENINTAELVKDKAYEFLFVLGQAKVVGAVQMIINPVAIR